MLNYGQIMGYITADPKADYGLVTGRTMVRFVLGSLRDFRPGGKGKVYDYISMVAFDRMAEVFLKYIKKDQVIFVEYALQSYKLNYDGRTRSTWSPVVKKVRFDKLRDPAPKPGEPGWEEVYYEGFDENGLLGFFDAHPDSGEPDPDEPS